MILSFKCLQERSFGIAGEDMKPECECLAPGSLGQVLSRFINARFSVFLTSFVGLSVNLR